MDNQYGPLLQQKIVDAQAAPLPRLTRRDLWLPAVPGKALAITGMHEALIPVRGTAEIRLEHCIAARCECLRPPIETFLVVGTGSSMREHDQRQVLRNSPWRERQDSIEI